MTISPAAPAIGRAFLGAIFAGPFIVSLVLTAPASADDYSEGASAVDPAAIFADGKAKEFHIVTVHVDGKTNVKGDANHPPEPIPTSAVPEGGGLIRSGPDDKGAWKMRAFVFLPSQVVVRAGDEVILTFIGSQGPAHRILLEGESEPLELKRGEVKSLRFTAESPGLKRFVSLDRRPSMQGSVLILPKE